MSKTAKIPPAKYNRRSILRSLVFAALGTVVLRTTVSGRRVAAAEAKATQQAVEYHDPATGSARCSNCKYFKPPSTCYVVEGDIAPTGWCNKYAKKPE
jgi:hypothetical protein